MKAKESFTEDLNHDESTGKELFHWKVMLHAKRTLKAEQLDRMAAFLKNTRNDVEEACKLVGVKLENIDEASMIDFNARLTRCKTCVVWKDISELNERDVCFQCIDDKTVFFKDNYDGEMP